MNLNQDLATTISYLHSYTAQPTSGQIDAALQYKLAITFVAGGTPKRKIQDASASADANAKCLLPHLRGKKRKLGLGAIRAIGDFFFPNLISGSLRVAIYQNTQISGCFFSPILHNHKPRFFSAVLFALFILKRSTEIASQ